MITAEGRARPSTVLSPSIRPSARLINGCAWNAVPAFANCGRAVAHVQGSYVPISDIPFSVR